MCLFDYVRKCISLLGSPPTRLFVFSYANELLSISPISRLPLLTLPDALSVSHLARARAVTLLCCLHLIFASVWVCVLFRNANKLGRIRKLSINGIKININGIYTCRIICSLSPRTFCLHRRFLLAVFNGHAHSYTPSAMLSRCLHTFFFISLHLSTHLSVYLHPKM